MSEKSKVYLLRIQEERSGKISLREIGSEQSHTFESLEALLDYLRHRKSRTPSEDRKIKETEKGVE